MASPRVPLTVAVAGIVITSLCACAPASPPPGGDAPATAETAVTAVVLAEADAGGRAVDLERADDGSWEVHVATTDRGREVRVTADGNGVLSGRDDDVDADDRAALSSAVTTMADAIRTAASAHGTGGVEEVSIDRVGGADAWAVSFVDGTEVAVALADGRVVAR